MLSLFSSQRACRAFQVIITDILSELLINHRVALQTLFMLHFATVFDSSNASAEFQPRAAYTLGHAPFYSLPWASDPDTRAKYICEEASWRQLPLISSSRHLVRRLQTVTQESNGPWDDMIYGLRGGNLEFRRIALLLPSRIQSWHVLQ